MHVASLSLIGLLVGLLTGLLTGLLIGLNTVSLKMA